MLKFILANLTFGTSVFYREGGLSILSLSGVSLIGGSTVYVGCSRMVYPVAGRDEAELLKETSEESMSGKYEPLVIMNSVLTEEIHKTMAEAASEHLPTVEPPNKGHFGANSFVPCKEVVPISEVK